MHLQPVFKDMGLFSKEQYPNAEKLYRKGFYIPSGLGITELQLDQVVQALHKIFEK